MSNCPGAPRLKFLLGRPEAIRPAADGTVPDPDRKPILVFWISSQLKQRIDDVTRILDRFWDAGFGPEAVVALLAS